MREVLVTGATGFVGGAVVRLLQRQGVPVVRLVRPGAQPVDLKGVRTVQALLHDADDLRRALAGLKPSHVIHLAAYGVRPQDLDPQALLDSNVGALVALLQVAADWKLTRFVHVGSCAEYGQVGPQPLTEDQPLRPTSPYGAAKAAAALLGTALAGRLEVPLVTLRLFGTYGPGEAAGRLVPWLVRDLRQGRPVDLTPGLQVRDFTYIDDVAAALVGACTANLPAGSAWHVCSGRGTTVRTLAEGVAALLDVPPDLLHFGALAARNDEPAVLVGDPRRFQSATGWRATMTLEAGLAAAVAHELEIAIA